MSGAGKTYLADKLVPKIDATWINADKVRKEANDWDFSPEGKVDKLREWQKKQRKLKKRLPCCSRLYLSYTKSKELFNQTLLFGWTQ